MRVLCAGSNLWKHFTQTKALQMDTFTEFTYENLIDMQLQQHSLVLKSHSSEGGKQKVKIEIMGRTWDNVIEQKLQFDDEEIVQICMGFRRVYFLSKQGTVWFVTENSDRFDLKKLPHIVQFVEVTEQADTEQNASGDEQQRTVFVENRVVKFAAGNGIQCVYTDQGFIYNRDVELATKLFNVKDMICGKSHCLLLLENGDVYSFGMNHFGQLGHGDLDSRSEPTLIQALAGIKIAKIACGQAHSVAMSAEGDLYIWGSNCMGEIGRATAKNNGVHLIATPTVMDFDVNVIDVACGLRITLVLLEDMKLFGCGYNEFCQLGLPTGGKTVEKMSLLKDLAGETVLGLRACSLNSVILLADK